MTDEDGIFEDEENDVESQHRQRLLQQIQQARRRYMVGYSEDVEARTSGGIP